jgi:hypothetical protein
VGCGSCKIHVQVVTPRDANAIQVASAFTKSDGLDRFSPSMSICSLPSAVICAENIALLYLLHSVPVPPSCNEINKPPFCQGRYSLSFTQERTLASTLAFLSNIEDDSNHVTALCIEENPESASLNVMLAVNKTKWEDGNGVLQIIKQSLEKIFTILSEISEGMSCRLLRTCRQ